MILLRLGLLLAASTQASVGLHTVEAAAEQVTPLIEAMASTSTPLHLRVVPFQAVDQKDAALAVALTDTVIKRFLASRRIIVKTDDTAPFLLTGTLLTLDGVHTVSFKCEDTTHKTIVSSNQVSFEEKPLFSGIPRPRLDSQSKTTDSRKFWGNIGAASMGSNLGWLVDFAVRDRESHWEGAVQVAGVFANSGSVDLSPNSNVSLNSRFHTHYERVRGSYLYPIHGIYGLDGERLLPLPGFLTVGGSLGFYHVGEELFDSRASAVTERKKHFFALPSIDFGCIMNIGSRQQLRLVGEYTLSSPALGIRSYRVGGLGFSGSLGIRFN